VTAPGKTLYYPVYVATRAPARRGSSLCWGRPCDTIGEAGRVGKAAVDSGEASLSFVVRFGGGEKTPLSRATYPRSARRVIEHWEALWDATDGVTG
jgi:hypothetical protein